MRHLTLLAKGTRGYVTGCGLTLTVAFATVHAQSVDVSRGALLPAQHAKNALPPGPKMEPGTLDVLLGQIDAFGFHMRNDQGGGMV